MDGIRILNAGRRRLLALLVINGLLQAFAMAGSAWCAQQAFDQWILGAAPPLVLPGVLFLACCAAVAALRLHERLAAERLGQGVVGVVRVALFDRLGRLPPRAIRRRSRGGHLLRFVGDLSALRQWVSLGLSRLAVAGIALLATVFALTFIDRTIALAVFAVLALTGAGSFALGPAIRSAVRDARRRRARLAGNINEQIAAMDTVQVFGQLARERTRLKRESRRLRAAMIERARWLGALRALTEAGAGIATLAILVAGAFAVREGDSTPGAVIGGLTVLGLAMPMLRDLSRVHEYWHGYRVARENIARVMDDAVHGPELSRGRDRLAEGDGALALDGIHLGSALRDVTLRAAAGERVAIVGGNGAGKSTLLSLVARLLDAQHGRILIDGQDIAHCRLNAVRRAVGVAGPELALMRGTLERNLRYRCPDASDEDLARVIQRTGLHRLIARLPDGLRTRIEEGGSNLSLGERQRVALARALLGDPRILILDEVDAHLDTHGGESLDRMLQGYHGTVLMVTHDPQRAARADRIWHLEHGAVLADGHPDAVLRAGTPTHRLLFATRLRVVA